jgi:hypothetical protein
MGLSSRPARAPTVADWWGKVGEKGRESAGKPGSVVGNHPSRAYVTARLQRPTRKSLRAAGANQWLAHFPIWSCSRWGLPCRRVSPLTRCALTAPFHPYLPVAPGCTAYAHAGATDIGGLLSVALSVGSRPPGVTWHLALWSPDFPPRYSQRLPGRLQRALYVKSGAYSLATDGLRVSPRFSA